MRVPRFHSPAPLSEGAEVALDAVAAQHAVAVLRLGVGAELVLFDGAGGEHPATLTRVSKHAVMARLGARRAVAREAPWPLMLGQGLARGERMDLVVQKATELGATAIAPLLTERVEVRLAGDREDRRVAHWRGVARGAAEQCGRDRLPTVDAPQPLARFLEASDPAALRLVLAPEGRALRALPPPGPAGAVLVVGPEGGLSDAEVARAEAAGFIRASLGPRVLRTETAGLAALAAFTALWG